MLLSGRPSASQRTVNVDQPAGDGVFREKFGAAAFTGFHLAAASRLSCVSLSTMGTPARIASTTGTIDASIPASGR